MSDIDNYAVETASYITEDAIDAVQHALVVAHQAANRADDIAFSASPGSPSETLAVSASSMLAQAEDKMREALALMFAAAEEYIKIARCVS